MHVCCSTFRHGHIQYLAGINIFVMAQIVDVHYIDDRITYVVAVGSRLGGDLPKRVTLMDLNCYIFFVRITDPTELRQGRNQYYRHKNKANGAVCMIFFSNFSFHSSTLLCSDENKCSANVRSPDAFIISPNICFCQGIRKQMFAF